jgi:hypothetical protein
MIYSSPSINSLLDKFAAKFPFFVKFTTFDGTQRDGFIEGLLYSNQNSSQKLAYISLNDTIYFKIFWLFTKE